jgi:hypothetical protein
VWPEVKAGEEEPVTTRQQIKMAIRWREECDIALEPMTYENFEAHLLLTGEGCFGDRKYGWW